ncbi:uncharacterized protein [Narcine bancroftii]|uniref:uncharacterized protein isoform X2 n=1 Tax=Narcine bancroftii TaxID=1343680 RepID=UPI0038310EEB
MGSPISLDDNEKKMLVPFFTTVCIHTFLSHLSSTSIWVKGLSKILPIICLCIFILDNGKQFLSQHHRVQKLLAGLLLSAAGDTLLLMDNRRIFVGANSVKVLLFLTYGDSSEIPLPPLTECPMTRVGAPRLIQLDSRTTGDWSVDEASDIRKEALRTNDGRTLRKRARLLDPDTAVRTKEKGWTHIEQIKQAGDPRTKDIDNLPSTWRAVLHPSELKVTLRREKVL